MIGGTDGAASRVIRVVNSAASPLRFEMDPQGQYDAMKELDDAGEAAIAIYHSHTGSAAYPSQTDVNFAEVVAKFLGDLVWVIASLEDPDDPDVRGFWIRGGQIEEAKLDVV